MVAVVACLLGGIALGLRFKVFILIPAVGAAIFFIGIGAVVANDSAWSALWTLVEVLSAIQAGYLMGASGADVAARMHVRRHAHLATLPPISNRAE
jgi:hypothetical protein